MSAQLSFSMRHVQPLSGHWFYSCVTLDCGCRKPVANPGREITKYDTWYCADHKRNVKILEIRPATLAQRDELCRVDEQENQA